VNTIQNFTKDITGGCHSLVYVSVASIEFSREKLTKLLSQSRHFNSENGITGLLLFDEGHFMQLLEGKKKMIENLMARIKKDSRHREVEILEEGTASDRQFSDWSMAFLDFASPEVKALPGYSNFLEDPIWKDRSSKKSARSVDMLHYFKAVMGASDSTILNFAKKLKRGGRP
jgi:Sensors of blue-light using FAD